MKDIELIILTTTGTIVLILAQIRVVLRQIALTVDQWRRTVRTIRPRRESADMLNASRTKTDNLPTEETAPDAGS